MHKIRHGHMEGYFEAKKQFIKVRNATIKSTNDLKTYCLCFAINDRETTTPN